MKENSTIAAIATALSPAGISIIRISGPQALDVIDRIYRTKSRLKKEHLLRQRHLQRKSSQMHLHIPFITAIFVMKMR